MTPNLAYVHISNPHWRCFGIWLPLFLLWIPAVILAPFILIALAIACALGRIRFWTSLSVLWGILSALPGTNVNVNSGENLVHVRII